ncbi:hypothetical protein [Helicobacter rodentium]|uniref:hypothetical protein n=1 Tax=Helicobacter rodentium TaxID=59617 RepID=UPI0023EFEFFE|nr:hypothetical protein [Helicobacter rodentium]
MNNAIDRGQSDKAYKEVGNEVMNGVSALGAGLDTGTKNVVKDLVEISNFGKGVVRSAVKPVGLISDIHNSYSQR